MDCAWILSSCFLLLHSIGLQAQVNVQVTGLIGQEVILPCTFHRSDPNKRIVKILWIKDGDGLVVAFKFKSETFVSDPNFKLLEPSWSNAALQILQVHAKDEGDYMCKVTVSPDEIFRSSSSLFVKAMPQNSAEANTEVIANGEEQTVATCVSANGRPPSQITWQTSIPGNVMTTMTSNTNGTYTVVSQYAMVPTSYANKLPITCIINHDLINTSIPLKLSVLYTSGGLDGGAIAGIVTGVLGFAIAIIIALVLLLLRITNKPIMELEYADDMPPSNTYERTMPTFQVEDRSVALESHYEQLKHSDTSVYYILMPGQGRR
ncbi:nectin-1-like [Hyperolius riggenbachi]|uniref:nectin-1-like n=1 Tax=Hyperolius riggenbachi TaxID=752182 RepID=UPI0035A29E81